MQSGNEGMLHFGTELFAIGADSPLSSSSLVQLRASNFTIKNLDIVRDPVTFLNPISPHSLNNQFKLGPIENKPLILSSQVILAVSGEGSPFNMYNNLELKLSLPSLELLYDLFAAIGEERLLSFPLRDVDNFHCWLNTLLLNATEDEDNLPLNLSRLNMTLSDIRLASNCVDCSSSGLLALNDILGHIQSTSLGLQLRLERLVEEITWGMWKKLNLTSILLEAPSNCPHSLKDYDGSKLMTQALTPMITEAPALSLDAMETIIGILALASEAVFVVAAKSHQPNMVSFTDPFSAQKELDSDGSSSQYIDFMNINAIVGQKIMTALASAMNYLRDEIDDDVTGERDLGFNVAMRRFFLDEDGRITMPLDASLNIAGVDVYIEKLIVTGLDTVSTIGNLLQPVASQTLSSSLTFDQLQFTVDIRVDSPEAKAERVSLSFGLRDAAVDFSLLLAADVNDLGLLELGSLLHLQKIPSCLLSHLAKAKLTQVFVKAGGVDPLQVGYDFLSYQNDINTILRSTHYEFYDDIVSGLPLLFDDSIRKVLNEALLTLITKVPDARPCRWSEDLIDKEGTIDFRDLFLTEAEAKAQGGEGTSPYGNLFRIAYQSLNIHILNVESINTYIRSWTRDQSGEEGSAWYEGDMFNSSLSVKVAGFQGKCEIIIADPSVESLDSAVDPLGFMEPVPKRPNELRNVLTFGDGKQFHVGARATLALSDGNSMNVQNQIDVGLSLQSFSYILQFFLNIPSMRLYQFPLKDIFNINCWLAAILTPSNDLPEATSAGVIVQQFQASGFDVDISCVSCSSPTFDEFLSHLYSPSEGDTILETSLSSLLGSGFLRDRLLAESSIHCPHNNAYDPEAKWGDVITARAATTEAEKDEKAARDRKAMWFNAAMAIVTGFIVLAVIGAKLLARRRHNQWIQSLSEDGFTVFQQQEAKEEETEKVLTNEMQSLFKSTSIPRRIRYGVPLALLADIALFAGGHFAVISTVDLRGHVAGETFYIKEFLSFSFIASIGRTYKNGGNEMAILMLIFSGLYPYMKLLTLIFTWFLPPRLMGGVKRRGSIILWMDVLAKLSVIDIVTMLLLAATLLVFIGGPANALSPETSEYYAVHAVVTPTVGFYCFVVAQRISRIASKYLLEWHHHVVSLANKELDLRTALSPADTIILTSLCTSPSNLSSQEEESIEEQDVCKGHNTNTTKTDGSTVAASRSISVSSCSKTVAICTSENGQPTLRSLRRSISNDCAGEQIVGPPLMLPMAGERQAVPSVQRDGMIRPCSTDDEFTQASRALSQLGQESFVQRLARFGGIAGVVFSAITVCSVFIIGIVIGPSIKLDTRSLWSALESGQSFYEAIQESFFRTISMILLQARFIMQSSDASYIGLLLLFCLVGISSILFPLTEAIIKISKWQQQWRRHKRLGLAKQKKIKFPHYVKRLYLWQGMDVYIISFIIAIWQLGAVSAYTIHLYCSILEKLFNGLEIVGLAEPSEAQCFRTQASLPLTMSIICVSFTLLLVSFYFQALTHYKSNIKHVEMMIAYDKSIRHSLYSQGLSKTSHSSSFWNLGATQLVDISNVEEEEGNNEKIQDKDKLDASQFQL
eukprot:scaffold1350_cov56-Cyclotella_meneghiniana.AAC.33